MLIHIYYIRVIFHAPNYMAKVYRREFAITFFTIRMEWFTYSIIIYYVLLINFKINKKSDQECRSEGGIWLAKGGLLKVYWKLVISIFQKFPQKFPHHTSKRGGKVREDGGLSTILYSYFIFIGLLLQWQKFIFIYV